MTLSLETNFAIPGYEITETIYSGSKTVVCRGIRKSDDTVVVIKLMRTEYPTFSETAQFRNQYTITKNLDIPGIIKPLSLDSYGNRYALIMEDVGGISLAQWQQQHRVNLQEFFYIAIQIVTTLEGIHKARIIHKDIKPANILINPATLAIKVIDFSIASLLPKEIQILINPNVLEGTLAYISPEQTGRMNRGIDYRSDFYSLGVTFFELLTGELPFSSNDPMELVYSHIAKIPIALTNREDIPPILMAIVNKLMAKNAEDRYQSAYGLKHDLEICQQQWETQGNIATFDLATKDISDRFLIPEKLYGRQQEVNTLLAAFEQVTQGVTAMVLVTGSCGVGKTAVVQEVHKPIVRQRSYFIQGKFEQLQQDIPLFGFIQACRDLISQILSESDAQIQAWKHKILSALGEQAQVIIDVIPELAIILGEQPAVIKLVGMAAENRLSLLLQRFMQIFTINDRPLVLFLDDLHWADLASLKFLQSLMSPSASFQLHNGHAGLLLIAAYRQPEIVNEHPLALAINEISTQISHLETINLTVLKVDDLSNLIADTLHCPKNLAIPLNQVIFAKTQGNPRLTHQFLKYLYQEGIIEFDSHLGYWQGDINKIQALSLTDDVVELMKLQLIKLPQSTQNILRLAACIGNKFNLEHLAILIEKSPQDTADDLWQAIQEGIIFPQTEVYQRIAADEHLRTEKPHEPSIKYQFIDDRIQQSAYNLLSETQRVTVHLQIGKLLINHLPANKIENNIFEIANQFNLAIALISEPSDRTQLSEMNLTAGRKALLSTAYQLALKYLNTGMQLLPGQSWVTDYHLTLGLYETAAEASYLAGNFEQMAEFIDLVLNNSQNILDQVKVYEIKIQAYGAQHQAVKSIQTALSFLKSLDVIFPEKPSQSDIELARQQTMENLADRQIADLVNLPIMTDDKSLAIMRILSSVITFCYQSIPELMPLICYQQINLSIQYGNSPLSAFFYAIYGFILCGIMGEITSGYEFGQLALNLSRKFNDRVCGIKSIATYHAHISHWKEHIKTRLPDFITIYTQALEIGNLEFAAFSLHNYTYFAYFLGENLKKLQPEFTTYSQYIRQIKQDRVLSWHEIYRQSALNLLEDSVDCDSLMGVAYNEQQQIQKHLAAHDGVALLTLYICKAQICYLMHKYQQAVTNLDQATNYLHGGIGSLIIPQFHFYDSLGRLAIYPHASEDERKEILAKVKINQEKLRNWSNHAPMNYLNKFYLVEAEYYRILGHKVEAINHYDLAITLAQEHEYIHEVALACELAAQFYLALHKQKVAQTYLTDAYHAYEQWGAIAKLKNLQQQYPQFISTMTQPDPLTMSMSKMREFNKVSTLSSLPAPMTSETMRSSSASISEMLDLASVIKASQILSGEIELEQLLSTVMIVVMENAGASKAALILYKDDKNLQITAVSYSSTDGKILTEFPAISIEQSRDIPVTLINYVKRTKEIFVTDDVKRETFLASDRYIMNHQSQSLLCIPIINQAKLLGILYLENNLSTGAFTRDRVEILKLLTTQAAISLENAMLYESLANANQSLEVQNHNLEKKVAERTQELQEKNQDLQATLQALQRTQSQLVQSEKMSSLGQMVAGIAHEINNPINFIHGNIEPASNYVQDLLDVITIYQQQYPSPSIPVAEKLEEIDIDFLMQDLPKILDSMKIGSLRIRNIVIGLRNFSRLDESEMKPVDIHEGIENTLMILQHRLKEKSDRPEIIVTRKYAQLPLVNCYAGQLNQVFMNIISNAIDALEESRVKNIELATKPNIIITTELADANTAKIRIADNGSGMTEAVKQKVFDPFFTTKPVGSGTGLGLSISYQVIVDKHQGRLSCNSTVGQGTEFVIEIPINYSATTDD